MEIEYYEKRLRDFETEGLFDKNLSLYLLDIPTIEDLQKGISVTPSQNDFFVFARGYNDLIKVGSIFETIISRKSTSECLYQKSIIKYISVRKGDNIDYLPRGYSAICLIEFPDGIPEIIKKIPSRLHERNIYNFVLLSQKTSLDYILTQV